MSESKSPENLTDSHRVEKKRDYSCEIISALVLLSLSALSHFWLLAIAAGSLIAIWALVQMVVRAWTFAALRVEFRGNPSPLSHSVPQVFLPDKIRPSVDC